MSDPIARLNAALEGRYRVEREIGEGGMATVYLAEDLRHERKVALKVLKPELAAVVGAERFLAEIKTTANLQHPHILPLFDSGQADGLVFFVSPFVEGESLRDRLSREKQLPADDAVRIATEVTDALDYAHRHGVIHRDIKLGNLLLHEGRVLVADFGIALGVGAAGGDRITETGLSLGTPHYMSPEQATGDQQVGPPTDTYALGCVLYEMLVGNPPYMGSTAQAILGKIITGTPDPVAEHRGSVPANVDSAIRRALEKVPADRFTAAQEFLKALADPGFRHGTEAGVSGVASGGLWKPLSVAASALAVVFAVAFVWMLLSGDPLPSESVIRSTFTLPEGDRLNTGDNDSSSLALSPDGQNLVYIGTRDGVNQLYHRSFDREEPRPIPGTEGATGPFFSPDGQWVGFFSASVLRKVLLNGGLPVAVSEVNDLPHGATWGPDDAIYFGLHASSIWRVSSAGGVPEPITILDTSTSDGVIDHHEPEVLPNGRAILFTLWTNSHETSRVGIRRLDTGEKNELVTGTNPRYVATGHLVFARTGSLWAVRFDVDRLEIVGEPLPLLDDLLMIFAGSGSGAQFAIASNGTLAYAAVPAESASRLVRVDREGEPTRLLEAPANFGVPRVSPDGGRVAVRIDQDIWSIELSTLACTRLTFSQISATAPFAWTPDGTQVTFPSPRPPYGIQGVAADGSEEPVLLLPGEYAQFPTSWSPDGETLAYYESSVPATLRDLWTLSMSEENPDPTPLVVTPSQEYGARFSPNGRWIAYASDESGRYEVYLLPYPGPGGRVTISTSGGTEPAWSPDGGALFYRNGAQMMVVDLDTQSALRVGTPEVLFINDEYRLNTSAAPANPFYDVLPGGERFVMVQSGAAATEVSVVQNFFEELRQVVPE